MSSHYLETAIVPRATFRKGAGLIYQRQTVVHAIPTARAAKAGVQEARAWSELCHAPELKYSEKTLRLVRSLVRSQQKRARWAKAMENAPC